MSQSKIPKAQKRIDISYLWLENKLSCLDDTLKNRTLFTNAELHHFLKELNKFENAIKRPSVKTKMISLYGHIQTIWINNQIDALFDISFSLIQKKETFSQEQLFLKINDIKKRISKLWHQNGLSKSNRYFIKIAIFNLNDLESSFFSKKKKKKETINYKLKKLKKTIPLNEAENNENHLLALDICEMASLFYQHKTKEAMRCWKALNPYDQERIQEICNEIGATSIETIKDMETEKYQKLLLSFIQAIVTYANEIVQGNTFNYCPSKKEIVMMFDEVKSLNS